MAVETLYADSSVAGTAETPENAFGSFDSLFTTNASGNWTHEWGMQNPVESPATGVHTFVVRCRSSNLSAPPTLNTITVKQAGVVIATSVQNFVFPGNTLSQDRSFTVDSSLITDPTQISVEIVTTGGSGSKGARGAVQVNGIMWSGDFTTPTEPPPVVDTTKFFQFL